MNKRGLFQAIIGLNAINTKTEKDLEIYTSYWIAIILGHNIYSSFLYSVDYLRKWQPRYRLFTVDCGDNRYAGTYKQEIYLFERPVPANFIKKYRQSWESEQKFFTGLIDFLMFMTTLKKKFFVIDSWQTFQNPEFLGVGPF